MDAVRIEGSHGHDLFDLGSRNAVRKRAADVTYSVLVPNLKGMERAIATHKSQGKIDEIIKLIRSCEDQPEAKRKLQEKYKFTERQAEDIVNLRLGQLTKLDGIKLNEERKALAGELSVLKWVWHHEEMLASLADGLTVPIEVEAQLKALQAGPDGPSNR